MKVMRWAIAVFLLAGLSSFAHAQVPDGGVGVKHSLNSVPITSLSGNLQFLDCSSSGLPSDVQADCTAFGAQAVFAGSNQTGLGLSNLSVSLSDYNPVTDPSIGCFGDDFFASCSHSVSDCVTSTDCTLTVNFLQGNGSGIGCGDTPNSAENTTCFNNGVNGLVNNLINGTSNTYFNPFATLTPGTGCTYLPGSPYPAYPPGSVCGSSDFALYLGGPGIDFNHLPNLDASFSADTPEPATLLLVGAAMLGMALLASKKRILA